MSRSSNSNSASTIEIMKIQMHTRDGMRWNDIFSNFTFFCVRNHHHHHWHSSTRAGYFWIFNFYLSVWSAVCAYVLMYMYLALFSFVVFVFKTNSFTFDHFTHTRVRSEWLRRRWRRKRANQLNNNNNVGIHLIGRIGACRVAAIKLHVNITIKSTSTWSYFDFFFSFALSLSLIWFHFSQFISFPF